MADPGDGQLVMQYPIVLPTDYDMQIIEHRVRTRGHLLDERDGLLCKAYCVRQVGRLGSQVNEYAPFYLWSDAAAAGLFLWGGAGFDGIVRDFGRPQVLTWVPREAVAGPVAADEVTHAVVRTASLDADVPLVEAAEALAQRVRSRGREKDVHLAVGGINPCTWRSVEFSTVRAGQDEDLPAAQDGVTVYRVLHVSQPTPWS